MRLPCFGVALSAMMLFRTGIGAIPFLLPLMLQVGFGNSAVRERPDHLCQFGRRAGDEAGHAGRAAAVRLPRHAGVERPDVAR